MREPTFDVDGYPTEETLLTISHWPENDPHGWLEFVYKSWDRNIGKTVLDPMPIVTFVTGGWDGNESIIAAMRVNLMLWGQTWESSHRGGRHVFRVTE